MTLTANTITGSLRTTLLLLSVLTMLAGVACNQANDPQSQTNAPPANIERVDVKSAEPGATQSETRSAGREIKPASGPAMKSVIPPEGTILGGVLNEIAVSLPKPEYTDDAKTANASGTVTVEIMVNEKGQVVASSVVSGPQPLWSAAGAAARQARFDPPLLDGKPVKVAGVLTYDFAK